MITIHILNLKYINTKRHRKKTPFERFILLRATLHSQIYTATVIKIHVHYEDDTTLLTKYSYISSNVFESNSLELNQLKEKRVV